MRISSCEISNFGKLSDVRFDFVEGQNTICQMNGWGKSTLSAFLRSMFYGFEGDGKQKIKENERKRYAPWQGGIYGGKIVISIGDREYLITRTFGNKKSEDTFECRDYRTNLVCDDYTENIGEELFGVDKTSFQHTVFIAQSDVQTESTDSINAKLGTGNGIMGDLDRYSQADKVLNDLLNGLNPNRKTGSANQLKNQITSLTSEINAGMACEADIRNVELECQRKKEELIGLQLELKNLNELQKKASKNVDLQAKKAVYEDKKKALEESQRIVGAKRSALPELIPNLDNVEKAINIGIEEASAKNALDIVKMLPEQIGEHAALEAKFSNNCPNDLELTQIRNKIKLRKDLDEKRKENQISPEDLKRIENFERYAGEGVDPSQIAQKISKQSGDRKNLIGEITDVKGKPTALIIIGIILALVGALLIVCGLKGQFNKVACFIAGIVCVIFGVILFINASIVKKKIDLQRHKKDMLANIEKELTREFAVFEESYDPTSVDFTLQKIYRKADDITELMIRRKKSLSYAVESDDLVSEEIENFFASYNMSVTKGEEEENLSKLKAEITSYTHLCEKYKLHKEKTSEYEKKNAEYVSILDVIGIDYSPAALEEAKALREKLVDYLNVRDSSTKLEKDLEEYITQTPELTEANEISETKSLEKLSEEIESTNAQIDDCRKQLSQAEARIASLQDELEDVETKKIELANKEEKYITQKTAFERLSLTRELLKTAKENLTSRYTAPLMNSFKEYYELVTGESADRFYMDANTHITYEEKGVQRDLERLSFGYQDLISVCQRFAYIDAMYDDELPFLVLDDPFVNLDTPNLEGAKKLLGYISKKYQLIYFTCHDDRVPKVD